MSVIQKNILFRNLLYSQNLNLTLAHRLGLFHHQSYSNDVYLQSQDVGNETGHL